MFLVLVQSTLRLITVSLTILSLTSAAFSVPKREGKAYITGVDGHEVEITYFDYHPDKINGKMIIRYGILTAPVPLSVGGVGVHFRGKSAIEGVCARNICDKKAK